jgi:sugar phosphate isomerase/epimerase
MSIATPDLRPETRSALLYTLGTGALHPLGRDEALAVAAEHGFRSLGVSGRPDHLDDWYDAPAAVREAMAAHGIEAGSMHSPPSSWHNATGDAEERRASVAAACASFEWAAELGAPLVDVHPNRPESDATPCEFKAARALSRRSLSEMAEAAERLGVRLALENMPPIDGIRRFGTRVEELLELIDGLGDHVGICFDTGHSNIAGTDPVVEIALAGDRLFNIHLQDNRGRTDQHLQPGLGTIGFDDVIEQITRMSYAGGRMFEVACYDDVPEAVAGIADVRDGWIERFKASDAEAFAGE